MHDIMLEKKIALGVTVKSDGGVAGEGKVVDLPQFHSWDKCTLLLINEYQLRLPV